MGIDSEIALADFGMQLVRRTLLTFVQAAKYTFGTMLVSALLFATISLGQKYPVETGKMGVVLLGIACLSGASYFARRAKVRRSVKWTLHRFKVEIDRLQNEIVERIKLDQKLDPISIPLDEVSAARARLETSRSQYNLARIASERGHLNEALKILNAILDSERMHETSYRPESLEARYLTAQLLVKNHQYSEAVKMLELLLADSESRKKAVDVDPASDKAISLLEREALAAIERPIPKGEKGLPERLG